MNVTFEELFTSFKQLNENEKKSAINEFLKQDINTMDKLNKQLNNDLPAIDINKIVNESVEDHLDVIYQLIHIMTEQVEMYTEKISNDYYEETE